MTTYGYARVSRKGQDTSPQVEDLTKMGADTIVEEVGSGGDNDRPAWNDLLARLTAGDALIVTKLDRASRSASYLMALQDSLHERGVTLVYENTRHHPTNRADRMNYGIRALFAEDERFAIRERTTRTLTYMRDKGVKMGRKEVLTPRQKVAIRQKHKQGRTISELARTYDCSRTTIRKTLEAA